MHMHTVETYLLGILLIKRCTYRTELIQLCHSPLYNYSAKVCVCLLKLIQIILKDVRIARGDCEARGMLIVG